MEQLKIIKTLTQNKNKQYEKTKMSREKRAEFMRKREMKAKLAIGRFNSDKVESFSDLQEMIAAQNNH